jgi:hypothetical protein
VELRRRLGVLVVGLAGRHLGSESCLSWLGSNYGCLASSKRTPCRNTGWVWVSADVCSIPRLLLDSSKSHVVAMLHEGMVVKHQSKDDLR